MSSGLSVHIEKLSRDNYDTWKLHTEAILIKNDGWDHVNEVPTETLKLTYESKGSAREVTLSEQLLFTKQQDDRGMSKHLNKFFGMVDKLEEMNLNDPDDMVTILLRYSIPDTYDNLRRAIKTRDDLPNPELVKIELLDEANSRKNPKEVRTQMEISGIKTKIKRIPRRKALQSRRTEKIRNAISTVITAADIDTEQQTAGVILALGIVGHCRGVDLVNFMVEDLIVYESHGYIRIQKAQEKLTYKISGLALIIVKRYVAARKHLNHRKLLLLQCNDHFLDEFISLAEVDNACCEAATFLGLFNAAK
ncbi:hypothetical protein QAD02_007408 [Eretmocerus hayati]|uniref:Uncharacterized protein n=1 Tax=Eretmocerus hayati TaxID=131215 RepID=A0ACC2N4C9_9HYME|nr:hypothetical protein QAD02_007408 [Eretmocerus hayati]